MEIPSFFTAAMKSTVQMNGVYVRFDRCVENLQRFCRPVIFHNEDPLYEASYAGSSFLLRYKRRHVVLCTEHQLGHGSNKRTPDELMIILEDGQGTKVGISPSAAAKVRFPSLDAANLEDIVLVEYLPNGGSRELGGYFYQLDADGMVDLRTLDQERVLVVFAIGYPSRFSSFETEFDADCQATGLDVRLGWSKLYLEQTDPQSRDIPLRLPLQARGDARADIGDPDGFSGAPVFAIYQDVQRQAHLGFAGMITHGSKDGRFMIYEAERIRLLLDGLAAEVETDVT
jgi:hypothetical protein